MRCKETRETTSVLLTALKKKVNVGMQSDVYESIWFKCNMMIDTIDLYTVYTSLIDLNLDSRSNECNKAKPSAPII